MAIVEPETSSDGIVKVFVCSGEWKSQCRAGRPRVLFEIRQLIREMSLANPLWGAPRILGELLKLGIDVGQTSVAKYMTRRTRPPSRGWKTFVSFPIGALGLLYVGDALRSLRGLDEGHNA